MTAQSLKIARALTSRGWMGGEELLWLADAASTAKLVVEIGSFAGRSSRAIADNLPPGGTLYCIDPLDPRLPGLSRVPPGTGHEVTTLEEGDAIFLELGHNLADLTGGRKTSDNSGPRSVMLWRVESLYAAREMLSWSDRADFIFLDGDHSSEAVAADIEAWKSILKPDGLLAGHDYYTSEQGHHPGVREAVDAVFGGDVQRPAGSIWAWRGA